jgi:hypothetical protein
MISGKWLFVGLSVAVWFVNAVMTGHSAMAGLSASSSYWGGLIVSFISIPVWGLVGGLFSAMGLFLLRLLRVNVCAGLSLWQKADIGLALAVVLKPALGIPF